MSGNYPGSIPEKVTTLHCPGVDIHASQRGERPDAVFLHGFSGSLQVWDPLWDELDGDVTALRYDLRDFGASRAHDEREFSHSEDLLAVLDNCAPGPVDLVGVSMGGAVALNFALDHPQRVRRLVLISPAITGWEWSDDWRALWRPIIEQARAGNMDRARQLWWQHPLFETTRSSNAGPALRASIDRFAGRQWLADQQLPEHPDLDRVHGLAVPTLLLTGERDFSDFLRIADLLAGAAPDLRRLTFPAAGHLLQMEQPRAVAGELRAFWSG